MLNAPISRAAFLERASGLFALALIGQPALATKPSVQHHHADPLIHPDPRSGITAEHVLKADALGNSPKKEVVAAYDAARERPEVFDGLGCACGCTGKDSEHRSLLTCYETKQPMGCAGCREEAMFVARQAKDGRTLAEIRSAVDKKYG